MVFLKSYNFLLSKGANPYLINHAGYTAIEEGLMGKNKELIQKVFEEYNLSRSALPRTENLVEIKKYADQKHEKPAEELEKLEKLPEVRLSKGLDKYKIIKFINSTTTTLRQKKQTNASQSKYFNKFYESFQWNFGHDWGTKQCLIFKYENQGNLQERIISSRKAGYTKKGSQEDENQINLWLRQLIQALILLQHKISHCDRDNIFLDRYDVIKIGDIGLTKEEEDEGEDKE